METFFQNLDDEHKGQIFVGDFNCNLLQDYSYNHTRRFNEMINLFQLTQLINHPTRITKNTLSLMDAAVVSNPENISQSGALHVGISDHSLIYVCRKLSYRFNKSQPKVIQSRDYKNYVKFQS